MSTRMDFGFTAEQYADEEFLESTLSAVLTELGNPESEREVRFFAVDGTEVAEGDHDRVVVTLIYDA